MIFTLGTPEAQNRLLTQRHALIARLRMRFALPEQFMGAHVPSLGFFCQNRNLSCQSIDPSTGISLGSFLEAGPADAQKALQAAKKASAAWARVPAPARAELVRLIANDLRGAKDDLGALVSLETGKILSEGKGEIQEMIDIADFAVGLARSFGGRTLASERPSHDLSERWHPLGCVGIVTAFNFPAAVWAWNALIALVCGNSCVWKPSPKAPFTALAIHQIAAMRAREAGHPDLFALVCSSFPATTEVFAQDANCDLLSFTGSSEAGAALAQKAAASMKKTLLECGGNNAIIVDETANLPLALRACAFAALGTAGQRCTSLRRLFVHESLFPEFSSQLERVWAKARSGDPFDPETLLGPLIDEASRQRFLRAIETAKNQGSEVIVPGGIPDGARGFFVEPCILRTPPSAPIFLEETFGPLLHMGSFASLEEAIALNNASRHGLSSSLFTQDVSRAGLFLSAQGSDCGIANINIGTSGAEIGGAFGGEKLTGGGREAGSDSWKSYCRRQTVTVNHGKDLPLAQGVSFDIEA